MQKYFFFTISMTLCYRFWISYSYSEIGRNK